MHRTGLANGIAKLLSAWKLTCSYCVVFFTAQAASFGAIDRHGFEPRALQKVWCQTSWIVVPLSYLLIKWGCVCTHSSQIKTKNRPKSDLCMYLYNKFLCCPIPTTTVRAGREKRSICRMVIRHGFIYNKIERTY